MQVLKTETHYANIPLIMINSNIKNKKGNFQIKVISNIYRFLSFTKEIISPVSGTKLNWEQNKQY